MMRSCGCCCVLMLVAWPLYLILWCLFGGEPDEGAEEEERAAIVTFLMD